MNVRELIKLLNNLPEDRKEATVLVSGYEGGYEELVSKNIKLVLYIKSGNPDQSPYPLFGENKIVMRGGQPGLLFDRKSGNIILKVFGKQ